MDLFLYDNGLRHERVKGLSGIYIGKDKAESFFTNRWTASEAFSPNIRNIS